MKPLVPSEVPTGTEPSVIAASGRLQALYVLSEYPVLAALACQHTEASRLDGKTIASIYITHLARIDERSLVNHERQLMHELGVEIEVRNSTELQGRFPYMFRPRVAIVDDLPASVTRAVCESKENHDAVALQINEVICQVEAKLRSTYIVCGAPSEINNDQGPWASLCAEHRADTFKEGHKDWKGATIWTSTREGEWND